MALLRNQKSFVFPAPPPSPIATGRGLRSAAVDDQILSEYLENNLRVPDLNLPQSFHLAISNPVEIDLRLLSSRDDDSIRQVLRSALQFGVFSIIGHGISADKLSSMMAEAEMVFQIPVVLKRDSNREKFLSFSSGNNGIRGEIGPEKHRSLSFNQRV
ncbi:uncharacterized protein LOC122652434 isoform X2 [Telopea speciosissima]|uniref:uncharacterized protein LOC122652434 isoform X2 n=1 Tax=Telopea speciosissima TaxID=54955 RepID=UPI001CC3F78F|nr:uncharacterized protein LOC122652434 isoform X2 [Telopea speciosissima]